MKHIPHGDESASHVSFGFAPLLIGITWVGINYGFSLPAVGNVEQLPQDGWNQWIWLSVNTGFVQSTCQAQAPSSLPSSG